MTTSPASEAQVKFIRDLMVQAGADRATVDDADFSGLTKAQASQMIPQLKQAAAQARAARPAAVEPPEGIHYVPSEGENGTVYKVQVAKQGSGRKYAKRLVPGIVFGDKGEWVYEGRSPLAKLSDSTLMKREDAARFGALYGMCAVCAATLTDEESIARGIGPVCAERF